MMLDLSKEQKKNLVNSLLDTIQFISSKNDQLRVWIRLEGPEVNDFDETCNNLSEIGNPVIKDYKDYGLSENQYRTLKKFRDEFEKFSDDHDCMAKYWINSPEWTRIRERAKEVLKAFNYQHKPKNMSFFSKIKRLISKAFKSK